MKKGIGVIYVQRPVKTVEIFSAIGKQGNAYQVVKQIFTGILAKENVVSTATKR